MQGTISILRVATAPRGPQPIAGPQGCTVESLSWRRSGHGSSSTPQRPDSMRLRQPQDGAQGDHARVAELRATLHGEPEDARLTGGTRSLMRRVLGLNVMAPLLASMTHVRTPSPAPQPVAQPAGRRSSRSLNPLQPQVA